MLSSLVRLGLVLVCLWAALEYDGVGAALLAASAGATVAIE